MLIFLQTCYSLRRSIFIKACDENSGEFWIIQDRDKLTETIPNVSAIKWLRAKTNCLKGNKGCIIHKQCSAKLLFPSIRYLY